jgi:hypothetical protein
VGSLMIGDFGSQDGIQVYRICGSKEDIYRVLDEARDMGHKFWDTPVINHVHNSQWTVLLKLKIPIGVGASDKT